MAKFKVRLRDDSHYPIVDVIETEVDFDGTESELAQHAHIVEVLGRVGEEKKEKEVVTEETVTDKKKSK